MGKRTGKQTKRRRSSSIQSLHHSNPSGWVQSAVQGLGFWAEWIHWGLSVIFTFMQIVLGRAFSVHTPGAWHRLDALWKCPVGIKSWADYKEIDEFYLLYDWLLEQLETALFLADTPECKGISLPWQHLIRAAILCSMLVLLTAVQLAWLALKVFCKTDDAKQPQHRTGHVSSTSSQSRGGQAGASATQRASTAVHTNPMYEPATPIAVQEQGPGGLKEEVLSGSGSPPSLQPSDGGLPVTFSPPPLQTSHSRSQSPQDVIFAQQPCDSPDESSATSTTALQPSGLSDESSRSARLADMRRALGDAGSETITTADAEATGNQSEVGALRLQLSSLSAQLTAAEEAVLFFRKLYWTESRARLQAVQLAKSAHQKVSAERQGQSAKRQRQSADRQGQPADRQVHLADRQAQSEASSVLTEEAAADAASTEIPAISPAVAKCGKIADNAVKGCRAADTSSFPANISRGNAVQNTTTAKQDIPAELSAESDLTAVVSTAAFSPRQTSDIARPLQNFTPAKSSERAASFAHASKGNKASDILTDTDDTIQIPALHLQSNDMQRLQRELVTKDDMIQQQRTQITEHAVKLSGQKVLLQQLQATVKAQELPAMLFNIRLLPTKGFKSGSYDLPYGAKLLGEGGAATIYQECHHGLQRATKYPKKGLKAYIDLAHELQSHLRCAGPNTVEVLSVGLDRIPRGPTLGTNIVCFCMELASCSLTDCIRQATGGFKGRNRDGLVFELRHTKFLLVQIVKALQGVHGKHTLHGDVKPDNLLVFKADGSDKSGCVKITDFGLSRRLTDGSCDITATSSGTRGTQGWTAPELYSQNLDPSVSGTTKVTAAADMYAAGWVFFEVLCGLSPLLFLEASTDDEFATNALSFPALFSRVRKPEISICGSISSSDHSTSSASSQNTSQTSVSYASEDMNDDASSLDDSKAQAASLADSGGTDQPTRMDLGEDDAAHNTDHDAAQEPTAGTAVCITDQQHIDLTHAALEQHSNLQANADDDAETTELVYTYPEYLLHGPGLQLLQLCMAMWSPQPKARPSWDSVLAQLSSI